MNERSRKLFADYVITSFRDVGDDDYIAARALYRLQLDQQFLWASLQALEKYLKAVLLLSHRSTKNYGHELDRLVRAVERIPTLDFRLPDPAREFLAYVNDFGENRYLDYPFHLRERALLKLDWTVWTVRIHSRDFLLLPGDEARYPGESQRRLSELWNARETDCPQRVGVPGGRLERILASRDSPQRPTLIWKNPCFGSRQRRTIRQYPLRVSFRKPTHVMRPEILSHVLDLVHFPKQLRSELESLASETEPKAKKR